MVLLRLQRQRKQASDLASNLPGHCPDCEWPGVSACCECKTGSAIDKMGGESWDGWAPGGGLANQAPGVTTFQVVQDKTNSINVNPGLHFAHRLVMISLCILGLIVELWTAIFEVSHTDQTCCLGPFPKWDSRCAVTWDFPALFKSACWLQFGDVSSAICFSFLLMVVYWK